MKCRALVPYAWMFVAVIVLVSLSPSRAAQPPGELPVSKISGVIVIADDACLVLRSADGTRYKLRGIPALRGGTRVTVSGVVTPLHDPRCRAHLALTNPGSDVASTLEAVTERKLLPASQPAEIKAPYLDPVRSGAGG